MKILALIAALTLAPCSGLLAQSLATGVNYNAETPIPPSGNLNITFQHDS
jgi:hypothetical protein